MAQKNKALVLGATGVAGRALLDHLESSGRWDLVIASRKKPYFPSSAQFLSVDLLDSASCADSFRNLSGITHIFYAAYIDNANIAETRVPNVAMFRNAMQALAGQPALEHVCLLQGTKYYGQYLGPFKTPAKESDQRVSTPHFYYEQQDLLAALAEKSNWSWSCARPHVICGFALGNPLNLVLAIAVYASLLKEAGLPLHFPGKPGAFTSVYQATDAKLLASAMEWMATTPGCANQAFNITNGDFFRYQNMWPVFADYFEMPMGEVVTQDLTMTMGTRTSEWNALRIKYGLARNEFDGLVSWNFANYAFSNDWDVMSDTTKCRKYGFMEFVDSEEMFTKYFDVLRQKNIIPPRT